MEKRDSKGLTEEEFLRQYDSSIYPKPSLTADIAVFMKGEDDHTSIMLIRRKGHPFIDHWALPGGFAEMGETIESTAARELEEETGVSGLPLKLVGIYSRPGRDPRGWTVTAAYVSIVNEDQIEPTAGDDAKEVCWANVDTDSDGNIIVSIGDACINEELAFDHSEIISDAYTSGRF